MKNIKEMIIPILVGFTLRTSIYNTIKLRELEKYIDFKTQYNHDDLSQKGTELHSRVFDIEKQLNMR